MTTTARPESGGALTATFRGAALILAGIAVAIYDARRHRQNWAIATAAMVGALPLGGLFIAIVSSVA